MAYLCRTSEDSCDFTLDMLKCNTNILPSCGNICISGFHVGHLIQLALVTTSPSIPYRHHIEVHENVKTPQCLDHSSDQ